MTKTITLIKTQKRKGRYNVYLDGKYSFPISEDVLIRFALSKGKELTDEDIENIKEADNTSKAYQKALNYLAHQLRTKREVRDHLRQNEIAEQDIESTLAKLAEMDLIDDLQYAQSFVRTMAKTADKGPTVIANKLRQKGVPAVDIEEALAEFPEEMQVENGVTVAKKSAKHFHGESFRTKNNKVRQQLMQKGFSSDVINLIMDELNLQPDDQEEAAALQEQGDKLWRKNHRYEQKQRVQKVRQGLYRKGFSGDMITRYLEDKNSE
ncbi:recombination regulator RecX [Ligilactobacillus acidipiscis]|uniref:recombination regulator RecX n=1 Tax=Ligilactobacillus acidipiscis TaxID=89059 RepID=UPI002FD9DBEF